MCLKLTCEICRGTVLDNLGNAYAALGDRQRAIDYYEQALIIDREIGDRRGESTILSSLARYYADLGDRQGAIDNYEQALVIVRAIGDRNGEALTSWSLARLLKQQGEVARAAALMQVSVDFLREKDLSDAEQNAARPEQMQQTQGEGSTLAPDVEDSM